MLWLRRADRPSVTPPGGGAANAHISKYGHSEAGGRRGEAGGGAVHHMLDSRFTSVSFQQFDLNFRTPHFSSTDFHFGGQQEGEQAPPIDAPQTHPDTPPPGSLLKSVSLGSSWLKSTLSESDQKNQKHLLHASVLKTYIHTFT